MNAPARKPAATAPAAQPADALPFRTAPHNIEAEQALLGAILVNNEAHDRVSGFLEPEHFYDPLHQQIYEVTAKLITSGKQATPITLRTFFERAEPIDAGLTVPQYLGRLAANAATIINARDYGRTIHDLAIRRQLILIGEDMVNVAFDSPGRLPAQGADRGGRDAPVRARRDRQVRPGLPRLQHGADQRHRHGRQRLQARRQPVRHLHQVRRPRQQDGRAAALRPDHPRRTPVDGQDGARHQHRLQRGALAPALVDGAAGPAA